MVRRVHAARIALLTSSLLIGNAVFAQVTEAVRPIEATSQDSGGSGQIEDIVVTAQRRSESAQSVPISLQSFSSESLQKTSVRNTEDLTSIVGGLVAQPTAARPAIFLRGIGTNSANTSPAVLTFVDGVYMPFGYSTDLVNVSSLEVLKGPQGTLFGRNATGGVIQITTKLPQELPSGRAEISYGNYQAVSTNAYVTGGLAQGVAMDLALNYSHQNDGYGRNIYNGDDVFFTNRFAARSRLYAQLSDVTSLTLTGDYNQVSGTVGTSVAPAVGYGLVFVNGATRTRGGSFFPGKYDLNSGPSTPGYRAKEWGVSLAAETKISDITLRSITSYRWGKDPAIIDFDGGPASLQNLYSVRHPRKSITQEIQIISDDSGRFKWTAGAFYIRLTTDNQFRLNVNAALANDLDESIAPYAQGSYEILNGTTLTLGGRFTFEKRKTEGTVFLNGVEALSRRGSLWQTFKEPTWRIALDQRLSRDALVYASVSRGFNAGFYNQTNLGGFANEAQNPRVLPEFLTAYEGGAKLDILDRHVRINLSGFWYDYKGLQQQIYNSTGSTVTINAGAARIKGVDFEFVVRPVNSLTLQLSGTYLDPKYRSYPLAPNYIMQPNGSVTAVGSLDAAGKQVVNAPTITYTGLISHVLKTNVGDFTTTANVNYRGKTYADPVNRFKIPTRYVLDVTERWTSADENLFVSLWAKNLLNKYYDYAINILTPIGLVGNPAPPRTYGMTAGFKF